MRIVDSVVVKSLEVSESLSEFISSTPLPPPTAESLILVLLPGVE
jgi:hypothetical protein